VISSCLMDCLTDFQNNLKSWLNYNFPDSTSDAQLKGVMEELGELCHADLKTEQNIRGYTEEKGKAEIEDAVGDIFIYLINYCNRKQISFCDCVNTAYCEIMKRDWQNNPENGETNVD